VITTKSGKKKAKDFVFQSHLLSWQEALRLPGNKVYGAGSKQVYDPGADTNLGPRFDSGFLLQNGSPGFNRTRTSFTFEFRYNLNDFFRKGNNFKLGFDIWSGWQNQFRLSYGKQPAKILFLILI
jgi:hypothetical protein